MGDAGGHSQACVHVDAACLQLSVTAYQARVLLSAATINFIQKSWVLQLCSAFSSDVPDA
jgi:hypothetical protein